MKKILVIPFVLISFFSFGQVSLLGATPEEIKQTNYIRYNIKDTSWKITNLGDGKFSLHANISDDIVTSYFFKDGEKVNYRYSIYISGYKTYIKLKDAIFKSKTHIYQKDGGYKSAQEELYVYFTENIREKDIYSITFYPFPR